MGIDRDQLEKEFKGLFGDQVAENLLKWANKPDIIRMACEKCFTFNITENVETIRQASYNLHTYGNIDGE